MGSVIKDFYKSDAPQFKGRSKEKRREMAVAAKLEAERGPQNEDVARDKGGNDKFDRYKRMVRHKQDKYGVSTLKQRVMTGADHNTDNEKKAKMKNEGMSPKEIMLQKKKTMLDQQIARDRKKSLNKAEPEAPTKQMGESVIVERGDHWHPDPEKDRKLGGPGANARAREDRADAAKPKTDPKKLKSGESYMDYAKRQKASRMRKEETEDSLKDRRMERGGVDGNNRYDKAPGKPNTFGKKPGQKYDGMSALEKVKASIRAKHGQGAIMDTKKK